MPNNVLWKRLTPTDFNAMNGTASPDGDGGGAMHIALGVETAGFPISGFLGLPLATDATVTAESEKNGAADLHFYSNPGRRGGEWTIRDQYSHRHPAWMTAAGFPAMYDPQDPPVILVFSVGNRFYSRFALVSALQTITGILPANLLNETKGIAPAQDAFLSALSVPLLDALEVYEEQEASNPPAAFNPADLTDGRKEVFAAILRRQGQPAFRKRLLVAYGGRCAITRTSVHWILEAAHIVPYRGPDTNNVQNGILLRADMHTMFDLGLLAINPTSYKVEVSSLLTGSLYAKVTGRSLLQPKKVASRASSLALEEHYKTFRK